MEKNIFKRLTSTTQAYFDRKGIKETAKYELKGPVFGRVEIVLHTTQVLTIQDLLIIEGLVFALMPVGVMFEFHNKVTLVPIVEAGTITATINFTATENQAELKENNFERVDTFSNSVVPDKKKRKEK